MSQRRDCVQRSSSLIEVQLESVDSANFSIEIAALILHVDE